MNPIDCLQKVTNFEWLSLDNEAGRHTYLKEWEKSGCRRPHDHPGFISFMQPDGYSAVVAIYHHDETNRIIYPFYWCELTESPYFKNISLSLKHIVSPYGYGGALFEGDPMNRISVSQDFEILFSKELRQRGFVTEFIREDIFTDRLSKRSVGQVIEQQPNVVVRLERNPDEIWRTYKSKVRKNVNRAKEHGLRVVFDPLGNNLDDFIKVYYETMERTEASGTFFISLEKFQILVETLGKDGGLLFVHIYDGLEIVSTELLLLSGDSVYSFLGGTVATAFDKRPNDLLKHEVILWGGLNGYKWYVLGGGITPGDGMFKYKEAFDPESIFPFQVRRVIHNHEAYKLLIQTRINYEKDSGNDWQPKPDFFPEFLS
ncbi:MAG: GNAT family N-acetyltransferase [Chlorobium sp.]|nr:GNAT family N-acetyltransferase [Chlorobium sp.]